MSILFELIDLLISIISWILLTRFWLQWAKADFFNPISQSIVKITNPILNPIRKLLPSNKRFDFASLILLLLMPAVGFGLNIVISGHDVPPFTFFIVASLFKTIYLALSMLFFILIIRAIASWIAPGGYNPALNLLTQLTEPFLIPIRRLIPPSAGIDWSPMVLMLIVWLLQSMVSKL